MVCCCIISIAVVGSMGVGTAFAVDALATGSVAAGIGDESAGNWLSTVSTDSAFTCSMTITLPLGEREHFQQAAIEMQSRSTPAEPAAMGTIGIAVASGSVRSPDDLTAVPSAF
jgi:hypothetical protein